MNLNTKQIKQLRGLAHSLKPVVMVGQKGLQESVIEEAELAIAHHELIKVKLSDSRDQAQIDTLCEALNAQMVQKIGRVLTLFRRNTKNMKIELN